MKIHFRSYISYITLGKTYCQSSRRLYVSETSLACGLVVHINLVITCFVQASDDWLLKMRINYHNQQLLRLINWLFPIIGTSLLCWQWFSMHIMLLHALSVALCCFLTLLLACLDKNKRTCSCCVFQMQTFDISAPINTAETLSDGIAMSQVLNQM